MLFGIPRLSPLTAFPVQLHLCFGLRGRCRLGQYIGSARGEGLLRAAGWPSSYRVLGTLPRASEADSPAQSPRLRAHGMRQGATGESARRSAREVEREPGQHVEGPEGKIARDDQ